MQTVLQEYASISRRYRHGRNTSLAEIGGVYGPYQGALRDMAVFYNDTRALTASFRAKTQRFVTALARLRGQRYADMHQPRRGAAPAKTLIDDLGRAGKRLDRDAAHARATMGRLHARGGAYARFVAVATPGFNAVRAERSRSFMKIANGAQGVMAYYTYIEHLQAIHHLHFKKGKPEIATRGEKAELARRRMAMERALKNLTALAQQRG